MLENGHLFHFYVHLQNCEKLLFALSCLYLCLSGWLAVHLHRMAWLLLDAFSQKFDI